MREGCRTACIRALRPAEGAEASQSAVHRRGCPLVVAIALLFGSKFIVEQFNAEAAAALRFAAPLVPILALTRLLQANLQGFGHLIAGQLPEAIVQPGAMMLLSIVAFAGTSAPDTGQMAFTLQLAATLLALSFGAALQRRRLPVVPGGGARYRSREWLATGFTFMWLIAMSAILTNVDTILIGVLRGPGGCRRLFALPASSRCWSGCL